jgi:hypothetical protein
VLAIRSKSHHSSHSLSAGRWSARAKPVSMPAFFTGLVS